MGASGIRTSYVIIKASIFITIKTIYMKESYNSEYRDNLAKDLKEIRKEDPETARVVLDAHKNTTNYQEAENAHNEVRLQKKEALQVFETEMKKENVMAVMFKFEPGSPEYNKLVEKFKQNPKNHINGPHGRTFGGMVLRYSYDADSKSWDKYYFESTMVAQNPMQDESGQIETESDEQEVIDRIKKLQPSDESITIILIEPEYSRWESGKNK